MATYYVRVGGSNAAAGTSPATAWQTISKALAAGSTVVAGDTIYVGAGTYRETVSIAVSGSSGLPITVIGDVDGAKTGDAGEVIISAYTTNDTTAPSANTVLDISGRAFLTLQRLTVVGGSGNCVASPSGAPLNLEFDDCVFLSGSATPIVFYMGNPTTARNLTLKRCIVWNPANGNGIRFDGGDGAAADLDLNCLIENCLIIGAPQGVGVYLSMGATTNKVGGVHVNGCTIFGATYGVHTQNFSTTYPASVTNCLIFGCVTGLNAGVSGEIYENYNRLSNATDRSNVSAGIGSVAGLTHALLADFGQSFLYGFRGRPFLTPLAGSPLLGRGDDGSITVATDFLNRPRPAGGQATTKGWGYLERHDTGAKETTTFDVTPALVITGPGDQDIDVPVDASATTISIKARYDTNHGATNKPQVILLAADDLGVASQTLTMAAAVDTWETLTTSSFTPTAKGWVTLRLVSRAAAGTGKAFFDTVA